MATDTPLQIAYGGTLAYYHGKQRFKNALLQYFKELFWTYNPQTINHFTRSGYFLFQAVKSLKEKDLISPEKLKFHFWGNIDSRNISQMEQMNIEEFFHIEGYCSKAENIERLKNADVLFLPLESGIGKNQPLFIPGKLYEYLKIGKPILGLIEDSDCKEILLKSGLGFIASPLNQGEVEVQILYLLKNINRINKIYTANKDYIAHFDFKNLTGKLASIFSQVLNK